MKQFVNFYAVVFDVKHPTPAEIGRAAIRAIGDPRLCKVGTMKGWTYVYNQDKSIAYCVGVNGVKYGQLNCSAKLVVNKGSYFNQEGK